MRSSATYVDYNSPDGFKISHENSIDETKIFKQIYNKNKAYVWRLDTIASNSIPENRKLAYKYYSEIPGVVWIEKTMFCDETEVANVYWQEFLFSQNKLEKINLGKSKNLIDLGYFIKPQFYFFPVVEVSYEDILDFCKWRTEVVTRNYNKRHGNDKNSENYTVFEYQLPTEAEWIKCATFAIDTLKYPHILIDSLLTMKVNLKNLEFLQSLGSNANKQILDNFNKIIKKDYVFNCKRINNDFMNFKVPFAIWSYPSNQYGLYNILGNVSEMVLEKGISKGGSFKDLYKNCTPNRKFNYTKPEIHLGFRCICKLKWPNIK